jgi:anaerobic selenocysteine-containing dehydrogenase
MPRAMTAHVKPTIGHSACPHDCPSTCALDVEVLSPTRIGRVRGAEDNPYTAGVICAKVARYAERIHHPDRLTKPLRRVGAKGEGRFEPITWEAALDETAEAFARAVQRHGTEAVWPYFYAGTMGLVMRDGINRLRHLGRYSGQYSTICTTLAWTGYIAGTGRLAGPDPREMAKADCVVIWGTNPVNTQINVMTHAVRARRERGAKIVAVDIYMNETMRQADLPILVKPGTDAALACAVMHIAFRDGHADRAYMATHADCPDDLERHLATRTPEWASAITGVPVAEIEAFAKLVGTTPRSYFRLGYGFARQRNGAVAMHAAASIATVLGSWRHEGGGAFHNNGAIFHWKKTMIEATDRIDPKVRQLDQSRIAHVLTGDPDALRGGPPVTAMLIQNTNPVSVAPEQDRVKAGFRREDLFVATHEQFMTETAALSDIVLPATMFLEHDDIYQAGGQQSILWGGKLVEAPGECRSNHEVIVGLMDRLGLDHPSNRMSPAEIADWTLENSGWGRLDDLKAGKWIDAQPDFETAHFLKGFGHRDGRFHFRVDWPKVPVPKPGTVGPVEAMPSLPDQWNAIETADEVHPFRLATSPARSFLNSTFTEMPTSRKKEGRPEVMIHPEDAAALGVADGAKVRLGSPRGEVILHARHFAGVRRGVLIAESIWPNAAHEDGKGINTLTGADAAAPFGGAAFHDNKVWLQLAS